MVIAQRRLVAMHQEHTRGLMVAQEEERARVAREVHDDAVQRLAVLQHELREFQAPTTGLSPTQRHHLAGIVGEIDDLADSLRKLAHGLHPAVIEQAGLVAALRQLAGEVTRTSGLPVAVQVPSDGPRLPADRGLALFRIAQESLRNAVKHADARTASVALRLAGDQIELVIEDDGRGFDPAAAARGVGLFSIRERARLAGGDVVVRSRPGAGTVVTVRVPGAAGGS
jgi:two-component system sensor histidine kinase UhpB